MNEIAAVPARMPVPRNDAWLWPRRALLAAGLVLLGGGCEKGGLGETLTVRTGTVVGRVTLEGQDRLKATVGLEGTNLQTSADEKGRFRLELAPPGTGVLIIGFEATDGVNYGLRKELEIAGGEVLDAGELPLLQTGAASGVVTLQGAPTHGGTTVFVPGTALWTQTASSGAFALTRLPPGVYRLVATAQDYQLYEYAELEVTPGETSNLSTIELKRAGDEPPRGNVSGRVFSLVGRPLEGAVVSMIPPLRTATTAEDGAYEFRDLDPAEYLIRAELEGKIANGKKATVRANETATVHLALPTRPSQDKPGRGGWNSEPKLRLTCPDSVAVGASARLLAAAVDPDGDRVTLEPFAAANGSVSSSDGSDGCDAVVLSPLHSSPLEQRGKGEPAEGGACAAAQWTAPPHPGLYTVSASASDGQLRTETSCQIVVSEAAERANQCPRVAITGSTRTLVARHIPLAAAALDPEGDFISYNWSSSGGTLDRSTGEKVIWTAPREAGDFEISVCVSDGRCPKTCAAARINVGEEEEDATFPACGIGGPTQAAAGSVVGLRAATYDPNAFPVKVEWSATGGSFPIPEGALANWMAPAEEGIYTVVAQATAASGSTATCQVAIVVKSASDFAACPTIDVDGPSTTVEAMPVHIEFSAENSKTGPLPFSLSCDAPNGTYQTFNVSDDEAVFEWFPFFEGVEMFTCRVSDGRCGAGRLHPVAVTNRPDDLPPFVGLSCIFGELLPGQSTLCIAFGKDPKDQEITFKWFVAGGSLSSASGESVLWTAPPAAGEYIIEVAGSDGANTARASTMVRVSAPGSIPAFSPSDTIPEGEYTCDPSTVALYHFNEAEGAEARDSCGSHGAVIRGAAVNRPGRWETAYSFDGWDDSVEIPSAAISGLANGTVEAWVKLDATWRDYELAIRRSEEADQCDLHVRYTARTQSWGTTWDNECVDINHKAEANTAADFGWHHIALTWDGVLWKMYQDGLLRFASPATVGLESNANPLVIGLAKAGVDGALHGTVDEVRISDRAREPEEFRVLAKPASPIWSEKSAMPGGRADTASAVVEGKLYVFGGRRAEKEALAENAELDLLKDEWSLKKALPTERWDGMATAVGRRIHVIGGTRFKEKPLLVAKNDEYDTENDIWTKRSDWPRPRFGAVAAMVDQQIHVFGGSTEFGDGGSLAYHDRYDPTTDRWTGVAAMPTARSHPAVAVRGGAIYVIGGASDEGYRTSTERYDPRSDTWTLLAPMPTPRKSASAIVVNDFIYVIGGEDGATLKVVEAYDPARDAWTSLDPLREPRTRFAATAFQRFMLLVGGDSGAAVLPSVLQGFLLPPRPE